MSSPERPDYSSDIRELVAGIGEEDLNSEHPLSTMGPIPEVTNSLLAMFDNGTLTPDILKKALGNMPLAGDKDETIGTLIFLRGKEIEGLLKCA